MAKAQTSIVAGLVGVAMVASLAVAFSATRVHASSNSELVELLIAAGVIPADKVAAARAAVAGSASTVTTTANFTRNLKKGDTGADVKALQEFLNAKGYTVAATGVGSKGMESTTYGPATAAAVSKFQEAYASEILTPAGLAKGTGYFGTATRAKANALAGSTTTTTTTTGTTVTGGEANVTNFKRATSPSNVEVAEGDSAKVASFTFDVRDADVSVKRVILDFEQTASASLKPWRYFDSIDVYVGDKKVETVNASSESDWTDLSGSSAYEITLNTDAIVKEGTTGKVTVAVNMLNNIDTSDEDAIWNVSVPSNGIRLRDGAGVDSYSGSITARSFRLKAVSNSSDELRIALDSANPAASTIKVDTGVSTNDVAILAFDITGKDADINVRTLPVTLTTSGDVSTVFSDLKLEVDGSVVGTLRSALSSGSSTTAIFDFDSGEFVIPAGDKVTVKVLASFSSRTTAHYPDGTTIKAEVTSTDRGNIVADTETTDLTSSQFTGTALGETHHLMTKGIFATKTSVATPVVSAGDQNGTNQTATYTFGFDVSAFGGTYYVSTSSAVVTVQVLDSTGAVVATGTTTKAISSSASIESGAAYRIDDGAKKSFTVTVNYDAATTGYYRVQLVDIDFGDAAATPTNQTAHTFAPTEDFQSTNAYIKA